MMLMLLSDTLHVLLLQMIRLNFEISCAFVFDNYNDTKYFIIMDC
jgi:hypothetical protein